MPILLLHFPRTPALPTRSPQECSLFPLVSHIPFVPLVPIVPLVSLVPIVPIVSLVPVVSIVSLVPLPSSRFLSLPLPSSPPPLLSKKTKLATLTGGEPINNL